ncbi:hypothetical protein IWX47DRAFT_147735 [Phyllosticta citricarpa]
MLPFLCPIFADVLAEARRAVIRNRSTHPLQRPPNTTTLATGQWRDPAVSASPIMSGDVPEARRILNWTKGTSNPCPCPPNLARRGRLVSFVEAIKLLATNVPNLSSFTNPPSIHSSTFKLFPHHSQWLLRRSPRLKWPRSLRRMAAPSNSRRFLFLSPALTRSSSTSSTPVSATLTSTPGTATGRCPPSSLWSVVTRVLVRLSSSVRLSTMSRLATLPVSSG